MRQYTPKQDGRMPMRLFLLCCLVALICILFSVMQGSLRAILQLLAVIILACGIYITVRYRATSFTYTVRDRREDGDGGDPLLLDFLVTKRQGTRVFDVCRIAVSDILELREVPKEREKRAAAADGRVMRCYNYTVNLKPGRTAQLVVEDGEECIGILLEADEDFLAFLQDLIRRAKAMRSLTTDA